MQLRLAVSHVIYFIKSDHNWFKNTSYPVLPNCYHFVLVNFDTKHRCITIIGTKNPYKGYTLQEQELLERVDAIFNYVIYSN